jgi:hypothetical protein
MNKPWHELNKMPPNATLEQRVRWHLEHAKQCGCRPVPPSVVEEMRKRGIPPPKLVLRQTGKT